MVTYRDSGVDVELGNDVSKILYNAARVTWDNRKGKLGEVIVPTDDFSGLRYIHVGGLPDGTVMNLAFDGIGTKVNLAQRRRNHRTMGYDLVAMVAEDCVVRGAEPVLLGSILDVKSLGPKDDPYLEEVKQLAEGYINAAKAAGVAVVNGEVAELPVCVEGYGDRIKYNWGAGVAWFANKKRLFTGREIQAGDSLIGLFEPGFRSNGLSLVRKILENVYGPLYHDVPSGEGSQTIGDLVLTPSKIYTRAVVEMFGGWDLRVEPKARLHGVVHVTGGGIPEKLGRVLRPSGLGAVIDKPFIPSQFLLYLQDKGSVPDRDAYCTWNFNHGMIIVTPDPERVMELASIDGIENKEIGYIKNEPSIKIKNMGCGASKEPWLDF